MASRLEFRILGPLVVRVDGASVPIGGPKQRALLALLLLSANRVVSRERLIGELFVDQSLNSADHALRNHVSRLRKVLGSATGDEPRLVARAPGYLLRVEPGELDLELFERLVAEGRESLAAGEALLAAQSLRAAEALWQGRPLADLEFEPFARVDVERLEELRLEAVEERIDAELALGRQRALVSELEVVSAEHPYRERFRAQLMLALYRCGRQAEGLDVYRQTRKLLHSELGLEPGIELQELERAILTQDATLSVAAESAARLRDPVRLVCPFKGLEPFETSDAEFFFGRERLVAELVARLDVSPFLAIIGPSGSGKSSLVRAGLLAALDRWPHLLLRPGAEPVFEPPAGDRLVVAVDQFEELFSASISEESRRAFIAALVEAAWDPERRTVILIALRADFFGRLAPYIELTDLVGPNHVLLGPMSAGELRRAIEGPAEQTGLEIEPELVDALVDDVAGEAGGLPLLSTALLDLWRERNGRVLALADYQRTGGIRGAVGRHAEAAFRALGAEDQKTAHRVFLRLVAGGDGAALTRRRVTSTELDAHEEASVARVVGSLVEQRLLVAGEGSVELVHEALLEHWPRLAGWIEESSQARRLHRHLTQAALEWEESGRDQGELYSGARLAAVLEWADAAGDDAGLNRLEGEFLEASRTAYARAARRLRNLLAVVVTLLLAALVAGLAALHERGTARNQATAAIAQRLGAQALVEPGLDRSLLLAREGGNLDASAATRSNLLAALLRSPAALAVLHGGGARVLDDALSADGSMLAIRSDSSSVRLFDTRTLRAVGPELTSSGQIGYFGAIVRPVRALAFSPDGRTLAVGDSDGRRPTLELIDTRTLHTVAAVTAKQNATMADVVFAPDGRTVETGEAVSGRSSPPAEVIVSRRARDGRAIRRSRPIPGGRLIGFTHDGRSLLVTSGETKSFLLHTGSFARERTFRISGAAALSPVGGIAAFGQDDGSVTLLDLATGVERPMARKATGKVIAVGFSADGKVLATTSDDGSVDVWDVPTRTLRDTFTGHAAAALGPVFSPDGSTLYSGSSDGTVIVWDVRGSRRLGQPFRFAPAPAAGAGLHHAPARGASTGVAVSPDNSLFATSPAPGRITLWRARDQMVVATLRGPLGVVDSIAFSHNGRLIAATGDAPETVVWDVATWRISRLLGPAGEMGASGVAFSPGDRLLGTAGVDGVARIYDLRTGRLFGTMTAPGRASFQDLDFSPDGTLVAAAGLGGAIVVWSVGRRAPVQDIRQGNALLAIRFSPDGKLIATGDLSGNVEFWDPLSGHQVGRTLGGQNGLALSVTFNRRGTQLLTTSTDGKLRLWDLSSGKLIGAPLPGADAGGWGTFFPDGTRVIAVFPSGTGVIWNVDPRAWRSQACRVAHRNLSRAEWRDLVPERSYGVVCPSR